MSIDVFFQPVDLKQWRERLFPYLRGEADDLNDLLAEAARQRQIKDLVYQAHKDLIPYEPDPSYPDWYDHDLMVWFRPYFLVQREPEAVASRVYGYHKGGPKVAIDIVREQVGLIAPKKAGKVKLPKKLPPLKEPGDLRKELGELREGFAVLIAEAGGEDVSPAFSKAIDLYDGEIFWRVMELNRELQPHWSIRAWFIEYLLEEFDVPGWKKLCQPLVELFYKGLLHELPGEALDLLGVPQDNEWCVFPEKVPALRQRVERRVQQVGIDLSTDDDNQQRALLSLLEALTYAEQHGYALAERIY